MFFKKRCGVVIPSAYFDRIPHFEPRSEQIAVLNTCMFDGGDGDLLSAISVTANISGTVVTQAAGRARNDSTSGLASLLSFFCQIYNFYQRSNSFLGFEKCMFAAKHAVSQRNMHFRIETSLLA